MQYACMSVGITITITTAYDTLGESGLTHSLNEPGYVGVFTNAELNPSSRAPRSPQHTDHQSRYLRRQATRRPRREDQDSHPRA